MPAASRARVPRRIVQARTSSSPTVKNEMQAEQLVAGADHAVRRWARRGRARRGTPLLAARRGARSPPRSGADDDHRLGARAPRPAGTCPASAPATSLLADVEHHQHRLGGEQLEAAQPPLVVGVESSTSRSGRSASSAGSTTPASSACSRSSSGVQAALGRLRQPLEPALHQLVVGEDQLEVELVRRRAPGRRCRRRAGSRGRRRRAPRAPARRPCLSLREVEALRAFALADARDVDVLDRRRRVLLRREEVAQLGQPRVGHLRRRRRGSAARRRTCPVAWCEAVRMLKSVVLPAFGKPRMPSCMGMLRRRG